MTRTLELLDRLVAFPTVSRTSNLALIDWAQALLGQAGFEVTRIPAPCGTKAGLFARIGPAAAGGICLSGHTDVVPAEGQVWTRDPFRMTRSETRVFGRGTTDMKGFVASALALAERVPAARLKAPLSLVLSYDEEVGCVGLHEMLPTLRDLIGQPRLVIVGEPTAMQVATGHKGKVSLRVTCKGEAGHSALAPTFLNAIHVASDFIAEVRALQDKMAEGPHDPAFRIPYTTLHIGKIEGGRALNIVPDEVTLDMEFRHLAVTPPEQVLRALASVAHGLDARFGREGLVQIAQVGAYPGLNQSMTHERTALVERLAGSCRVQQVEFGTEGGWFAEMGHAAVVIGPGDMASDGHKPDEGIDLEQLVACDGMMDQVVGILREDAS